LAKHGPGLIILTFNPRTRVKSSKIEQKYQQENILNIVPKDEFSLPGGKNETD